MKAILSIAITLLMTTIANAQVYPPSFPGNPWRLENSGNYCENSEKEKHLWQSINYFAKSIKSTFPSVPPEQLSYIKKEWESGNANRAIGIKLNPFSKIKDILEMAENLERLSGDYIKYQKVLPFVKKAEFIGRTMMNVSVTPYEYDDIKQLSRELVSRSYRIEEKYLQDVYFGNLSLRTTLIFYLICYGEKNSK